MTLDREPALISRLTPHPLREEIYGELHARPTPLLEVPLRASHLVFLTDLEEMAASHAHVVRLAKRYTTIGYLNTAWRHDYASFTELFIWPALAGLALLGIEQSLRNTRSENEV